MAKASGSKRTTSRKIPAEEPPVSDDYTDEEVDANDYLLDEEEEDAGVAVWAPDEWDGEDDSADETGDDSELGSESDDDADDNPDLTRLQRDLQNMPLSTLMKAQRSLRQPQDDSEDSDDGEDSPGAGAGPSTIKAQRLAEAKAKLAALQRQKGKAKSVPSTLPDLEDEEGSEDEFAEMRNHKQKQKNGRREDDGPVRERVKRDNKHAPTAMSTKKQVSRNRLVVDVPSRKDRRDPRFDTLSSNAVDPHLQSQSYSFIPQMLKDELAGLRTAVKMAVKAEAHCPWAEKPARTAEREMLELQLGRLRTRIERGEREAKERGVLAKAKKDENEKRGQGKGAWYLKKSDKKDLLLKARFEDLEKTGGKTAVKKAMEKKRKKVAGKEKKSRPFAPGSQGGSDGSGKRRRTA